MFSDIPVLKSILPWYEENGVVTTVGVENQVYCHFLTESDDIQTRQYIKYIWKKSHNLLTDRSKSDNKIFNAKRFERSLASFSNWSQ